MTALVALTASCSDGTPPRLINLADGGLGDGVTLDDSGDVVAPGPDGPRLLMYEVLRFDPGRSEFPDAVTTREGRGYVALRTLNRVVEVSPDGAYRAYAEVPAQTTTHGLAFDAMGRLLITVVSPRMPAQTGLWRAGVGGGVATLLAHDDALRGPAGVTVDSTGAVWVTDSDQGAIWRAPSGSNTLTRWSSDASLAGGAVVCGPARAVRTGANGVVVDLAGRVVFVTNSDRSTLVRVAINTDGSAGAVTALTMRDCARMGGAWGLSAGPSGSLLVSASVGDRVTRVGRDGSFTAVDAPAGLLRTPLGLAYDSDNAVVWVASSANAEATTPGGSPIPGVARVPVAR